MPNASQYVTISAPALALVRNLQEMGSGAAVMAKICEVIDYQNELTTAYIQEHFLSGPGKKDISTLAVVTGRLRQSARPVKAVAFGDVIISGIGSNVKYAAAHEFGVDEDVSVRAYTRRNSIQDRFAAPGGEVNRMTALRLGLLSRKQASAKAQESGKYVFAKRSAKQTARGGTVAVRAHTMHMRLVARRCFQRGIEARLQIYGEKISAALIAQWGRN